jgi:hypothetical protein
MLLIWEPTVVLLGRSGENSILYLQFSIPWLFCNVEYHGQYKVLRPHKREMELQQLTVNATVVRNSAREKQKNKLK